MQQLLLSPTLASRLGDLLKLTDTQASAGCSNIRLRHRKLALLPLSMSTSVLCALTDPFLRPKSSGIVESAHGVNAEAHLVHRSPVQQQHEAVDNNHLDANGDLPGHLRQVVKDPVDVSEPGSDQRDDNDAETRKKSTDTHSSFQNQFTGCHDELLGQTLAIAERRVATSRRRGLNADSAYFRIASFPPRRGADVPANYDDRLLLKWAIVYFSSTDEHFPIEWLCV